MNDRSSIVGWREWAVLPDLDIPAIKVKIDTGARTSALHALNIERISVNGSDRVRFLIQPLQRNTAVAIQSDAPLVDIRSVSDSGGHKEKRLVISSTLQMGPINQEIDITLTERKTMLFRMLIGRTALADNVVVDPSGSYLCGQMSSRLLYSSNTEAQT